MSCMTQELGGYDNSQRKIIRSFYNTNKFKYSTSTSLDHF